MAFFVITIWHIFNAHLNPDVFPFDTSMFTGKVSRERYEHEHPLELARIEGRAPPAAHGDAAAGAWKARRGLTSWRRPSSTPWSPRCSSRRWCGAGACVNPASGSPCGSPPWAIRWSCFRRSCSLFPLRAGEGFHEGLALFAGRRWEEVRLLGAGLFDAVRRGPRRARRGAPPDGPGAVPARRGAPRPARRRRPRRARPRSAELARARARARVRPPPVVFVDRDGRSSSAPGCARPALVVSRGALRLLDGDELRVALAHELAHLVRRDPAASWAVLAARVAHGLQPGLPGGRARARPRRRAARRRAGRGASAATGWRLRAACSSCTAPPRAAPVRRTLPFAGALSEPLARVRARDVEVRCRRLLDPAPPAAVRRRARGARGRRPSRRCCSSSYEWPERRAREDAGLELARMLATLALGRRDRGGRDRRPRRAARLDRRGGRGGPGSRPSRRRSGGSRARLLLPGCSRSA